MARAKRCNPGLETLEGKALMTAGLIRAAEDLPVVTDPVLTVPTLIMPNTHGVRQRAISGNFSVDSSLPDTGSTYQLNGTGAFRNLGQLSVAGSVSTPGFIRSRKITGRLTMTSADTSDQMTVSIVSNQNPLSHAGGSLFYFKVQSATGKFKNAVASGKLQLSLVPDVASTSIHTAEDDPEAVTLGFAPHSTGTFSIRILQTKA